MLGPLRPSADRNMVKIRDPSGDRFLFHIPNSVGNFTSGEKIGVSQEIYT